MSQNIGVLGMKHGERIILRSNTMTPTECLRYALNLPTSVITSCDSMEILIRRWKWRDIPTDD
jgi:hypothetical protein